MGILSYASDLYGKKKNKPKLFEHTFQGKFLKGLSKTGIYSPEVKRNLMGRMGSEMGGVAARRTAQNRGYLASRGMTGNMGGTSIAAAKLMDAPGRDVQRTLGRESMRIDTENEMSKLKATEQLATGKDVSRGRKRAWRQDFYSSAGAGLDKLGSDAAMAYMTGGASAILPGMAMGGDKYMQAKQYKSDLALEQEYNKILKMMSGGGSNWKDPSPDTWGGIQLGDS